MKINTQEYQDWIQQYDTLGPADLEAAERFALTLPRRPGIDVVMPVFDPPAVYLEEAIASVRRQIYPHWKLYLFDDGSKRTHVRKILDRVTREDTRIHLARSGQNRGIATASNGGLGLGRGEYVFFLDHDDSIAPHTLLLFADAINRIPDANLIYSDSDVINEAGERENPYFKPDVDHELLLGVPFAWGLFRRTLLEELGGMRDGYPGSEDNDLLLRVMEHVDEKTVVHIPHILWHWRKVPTSFLHTRFWKAFWSSKKAVSDYCARRGMDVEVRSKHFRNQIRARSDPGLSTTLALEGAFPGSLQKHITAVGCPGLVLAEVERDNNDFPGRFRNEVLRRATTELVAFVDVRLAPSAPEAPRDRGWLCEMATLFKNNPHCAAVGGRINGSDGRIEQCGLLLGVRETPAAFPVARAMHGDGPREPGYVGWAHIARRTSAVAGGVLVVSREAALEVGGFDETLAESCAVDLDFSLRVRNSGKIVLLCPCAEFDAQYPVPWFADPRAAERLYERWGAALYSDPYHNPNLADIGSGRELAFPPRVSFPWRSM